MPKREISKGQVLGMWQQAHGKLSARWQSEFLKRSELEEIVLYPTHAVADALAHSRELKKVLRILRLRWVKSPSQKILRGRAEKPPTKFPSHKTVRTVAEKPPISNVHPKQLRLPLRPKTFTKGGENTSSKRKSEEAHSDLAEEGKIFPLPDAPIGSRRRGSPGYKTGIEAELRSIAQKHKWF